jgi:hypothetical protein
LYFYLAFHLPHLAEAPIPLRQLAKHGDSSDLGIRARREAFFKLALGLRQRRCMETVTDAYSERPAKEAVQFYEHCAGGI